jgi:uncharacterized protein (TIGR02145 family)
MPMSLTKLVKPLGISLFFLSFLWYSCKKDENTAILKTLPVSEIARTSALFTGQVLTGTDSLIEHGFCYSTEAIPILSDQSEMVNYSSNNNSFTSKPVGLLTSTKYFVRAYAKTIDASVIYGDIVNFVTRSATFSKNFNSALTYGSVSDIDGNIYKTIAIGDQTWMAENLQTTRLNDGSAIPLVENIFTWITLQTPGFCWYENNGSVFRNIYGAYYNWHTINTGLLCPDGWHVPSEEDWKGLKITLGMSGEQASQSFGFAGTNEGDKISETGNINWIDEKTKSTNESGFTALPGGTRSSGFYDFEGEGASASWWSATSVANSNAWTHGIYFADSRIWRSDMLNKSYGHNVRCLKDKN